MTCRLTALWIRLCVTVVAAGAAAPAVLSQDLDWPSNVQLRGAFPPDTGRDFPTTVQPGPNLPANTTVVPRAATPGDDQSGEGNVDLVALLTVDGQRIDEGVVWRIFGTTPGSRAEPKLIMTKREASPTVQLAPGEYVVNAAFGRADITRKITVTEARSSEKFVLNAGGLKVKVLVDGVEPPLHTVAYDILSGERDQSDNRIRVLAGAKPNVINRLNAGIYRIVSHYGDANAKVEADVTVEAGKLTEATISHSAARVTFKLVTRLGGEALPDTQWTVQTPDGEVVMRSVGALPTHILAPGSYSVTAKSSDRAYKRDFTIANGEIAQVEVLMQ